MTSTKDSMNDTPEDGFFEAIAGRNRDEKTGLAMREALVDEASTIKEAESAQLVHLPEYEMARLAAVKKQLFESGIFKDDEKNHQHHTKPPLNSLNLIKNYFTNSNWTTGLAFTASVLVATTLLLQQPSIDNGFNPDAIRGSNSLIIIDNQPGVLANSLTEKLTFAGAEVVKAQINGKEWVLDVSVAGETKVQNVKNLLSQSGLKIETEPPYQIIVKTY